MSTKKKIKRSLSQRTLGFTKFMSPFKNNAATAFGSSIPENGTAANGGRRLLSAMSDPQLNVGDFSKQVVDKNGRIITSSPDINGNDVVYSFKMLEQRVVPDTFLPGKDYLPKIWKKNKLLFIGLTLNILFFI